MAPRGYPEGFTYVPAWEIAVGWFLMCVAVLLPLLYFRMNSATDRTTPEWAFCVAFMVFFLLLGRSLAFQSFRAVVSDNAAIHISQDMRMPATDLSRKLPDWRGTKTGTIAGENGREYIAVYFVGSDGPHELYRTVNAAEAGDICNALEELRNSPAAVPELDSTPH